jgi:rhamnose utilization protein RhaD (predicted bifunctional aldolase and dehydrogenase)
MNASPFAERKAALIALSHELGAEHRQLAILGEGNTSAKLEEETFLVKASGSSLGTLEGDDIVACRFEPLLAMLEREDLSDQQIEDELLGCRVDPSSKKPSIESLFHAYLLSLPGVEFVGHVHPIAVNQILCSPRARDFAGRRICPDEVVCCGPVSVLVPYTDPGLSLAKIIRCEVVRFVEQTGAHPRVILLESHGMIALGASPSAVKAAIYMADKSARIFIGAAAAGGPIFLDPSQVSRLTNRIDEHHRQRVLKL